MIIADLSSNEALRLADLESYNILDTQGENDFDELVELASRICGCPISLITLLDSDRQWFKAKKGLEGESTSRDVAFCAHAILQNGVMTVQNALEDERFADNPFVLNDPNVRFYAGAPIISPAGYKLGTLCIIDNKPRTLSLQEEQMLQLLSGQVTKLLELRKKNSLIRKQAAELIDFKSKAIGNMMQAKEDDKKAIADSLHEDLAQKIAACMMALKVAEEGGDNAAILKEIRSQLDEVLNDMRQLSYKIMPPTLSWISPGKLINEFVEKIETTFPFSITFKDNSKDINKVSKHTLAAIRILEEWLKVLYEKKSVSVVNIQLLIADDFELIIEDDGSINTEIMQSEFIKTLVQDRVHSLDGSVHLNGNTLKIILPE